MKAKIYLIFLFATINLIANQLGFSQIKPIEFNLIGKQLEDGQNLIGTSDNYNFYLTMKNKKVVSIAGYNLKSFKSLNVLFKTSDLNVNNISETNGKVAKHSNGEQPTKGSDKTSKPMCIVCETYPCSANGATGSAYVPGSTSVQWCVKNCALKPCSNHIN